ncbi:MAG TPA: type II toxin-antitoxin system VapC family toxin [Allosphingosinicella sp.]|nr:type II toxin-antitoxin system VapC family toxin [Allosphingosinicella sp.]
MIVDTSALVAIAKVEEGARSLAEALSSGARLIPAPVVTEFNLVTSSAGNQAQPEAQLLISRLRQSGCRVTDYSEEDAALSIEAHRLHGRGNGRGGKLNMLDIMVYCMAKRLDRPILCTGRDFASTDASIHPASRGW